MRSKLDGSEEPMRERNRAYTSLLFLGVGLTILGLLVLWFRQVRRAPDVLLVVVDTLRADRLPAYGYPHARTPALDRLAAEGVVFERAVAASANTLPSHASLFTSRWVREHSIGHGFGPAQLTGETTLAERFRDAGYATAAFVSNVVLHPLSGIGKGFDVYDCDLPIAEPNRPDFFERPAEQTTQRAVQWLEGAQEAPVFLVVHYQDPHGPYTPPADLQQSWLPAEEDEPRLPLNPTQSGYEGIPAYQALPDLDRPSQYESRYVGEIMYMDRWLGRLLDAFDRHRKDAGHIVLFTADHGESMGEAGFWFSHGHATTPDLAHVPFILRAPGIEPGRSPYPVSHVDAMPTLLELAGLTIGDHLVGIPLGTYLRSGTSIPLPSRSLFCDLGFETSVYREGGFLRLQFPSFEAGDRGRVEEAEIGRYSWLDGARWSRGAGAEEAVVDEDTRAYLSRLVPRREMPSDPVPASQLRALGYLEPESD